jgi:hypothetical protein
VQQDTGVPPSGSGHSAKPEPCSTVSAVPASVPNAIADKLDEARALIEEHGWTQGGYLRDGCYCALGAIAAVGDPDFDESADPPRFDENPIADAFRQYLGVGGFTGLWENSVVAWNDAAERTQAEVIEAFRKAAELARAEGL